MVCAPVRRDNPRALASGFYPYRRTTMLYLTCTMKTLHVTRYLVLKVWVSWDCGTKDCKSSHSYDHFISERNNTAVKATLQL